MNNRILLSALSASLLVVGAPVHANLISNGSFESGAKTGNTDTTLLVDDNTTMAGWAVVNDRIDWITGGSQWGLAPADGNAFLDLTRLEAGPPFGGVSQQITTTAGQKYLLTFSLGSYTERWGGPSVSITASAGATSQTFTNSSATAISTWTTEQMLFTASGASTLVTLVGSAGYNYIGLDAVSVELCPAGAEGCEVAPPPSNVPVPATLGLLALGAVGIVRFRRP